MGTNTSPPLIVWLDEIRTLGLGPGEVGGKASGLASLVAAGLPVPSGFVITTAAFGARAAGLAAPTLNEGARAGIIDAYRRLVGYGADQAVAVRSSATVEDGVIASHAGQFLTTLGVSGGDAVVKAAIDCVASLHAVAPERYRAARLGETDATTGRMAVVVQRMVEADAAGVAFTIDPINGDRGTIVVNAARGLGTSVVDGTAPADRAWVDRKTLAVVREAPGTEAGMSVSHHVTATVARLALAAEAAIGAPVDVEWAARDGATWLLQARPVTGVPELIEADASDTLVARGPSVGFPFAWDEPADASHHWRRDGRPTDGPNRPWDDIERASFGRARDASGATLGRGQVRRSTAWNGYAYSTDVADPVPGHVREAQRLAFDAGIRAVQASGQTYWEAVLEPDIVAGNRVLDAIRPDELDGPSLARYFDDVLAWHERLWVLHLHLLHTVRFGPHTFRGQLEALLVTDIGREATAHLDAILSHVPTATSASIEAVAVLARLVGANEDTRAEMLEWPPRSSEASTEAVARFREGFAALLERYSLRADAGAFTVGRGCQPGWRDRPDLPLTLITRYAAQASVDLESRRSAAVGQRDSVVEALRARLPDDASRGRFDRLVGLARREVQAYENHNHAIDASASALLWRARDAVSKALHARGVLLDSADVVWLTRSEIDAALRDADLGVASRPWSDLVTGRKSIHKWQRALVPPDWLGIPPVPQAPAGPVPVGSPPISNGEPAPASALVVGQPGSRGIATGRVRHVPTDAEVPEVEPGDILVARNAGALWAPALPLASAVVLEEGALLQHAMLICREFGVPGIVQAAGARERLAEGRRVTVDGTRGWVEPARDDDEA